MPSLVFFSALLAATHAGPCPPYFYETTTHGWSYRNVTAFGADPTGATDSTAAFSAAIDYARGGEAGSGQDKQAAMVYVPSGTYLLSDTLVLWKWTKLQGNPYCPPTLLVKSGTPAFSGASGWRPLLVAVDGFNSSTAAHAWWDNANGQQATNENFFTQLHHLDILIEENNPGLVAVNWNVAQQSSLRSVRIRAASDTPVALDIGAGPEYEHYNAGVPYTLGGGGVVEDVTIQGAPAIGVRVAAAQFALRNLAVASATRAALQVSQLAWSIVVLNSTFAAVGEAAVPVEVLGAPQALPGALTLLDCRLAAEGSLFIASQGSALVLQNLQASTSAAGPCQLVQGALPCPQPSGGAVALWAQGAAFASGAPASAGAGSGALPLPSTAAAREKGVPLACSAGRSSALLCGGSAEDPATAIPHVPRPVDFGGSAFANAVEAGCSSDGVRDATACLAGLLREHANVFLPFGIYLLSDTLLLRNDTTLLGEGLSVLRLAPAAPGYGNPAQPKAVLATPPGGSGVRIADIALWQMDCGNSGAVLLEWGATGSSSSLHDVNMLVAATTAAKAVVVGGSGYFSNTWWPATMAYQPDLLHRLALAAVPPSARRSSPTLSAAAAADCAFTQQGVVLDTPGPLFWVGLNLEHSVEVELVLAAGTTNVLLAGFQTEEARVALVLNNTKNAVVYGSLNAFWNASEVSPTPVLAERAEAANAGAFDLSYRVYALSVPISASETELFVDSGAAGYTLSASSLFASAAAILNY